MEQPRAEVMRTLRELLSYRRLLVTFGVAGTMGVIEWLGLGHPIGLLFGLAMGLAALLISPLPWLWILPWGLKRSPVEVFFRALAVIAISSVVVVTGFAVFFAVRDAMVPHPHRLLWAAYAHLSAWSSVVISIPLFTASGWGISRHMQLERRLEIHDEREISLRNALQESRMLAMQSRLDPHFLFNALNLVAELCREDPLEAERCVVRLSALLRAALDRADQPMIALSSELDLCADYLELCRVRFGDRLRVRIDRCDSAEPVRVPSLAVQVLCENAVRHGVEKRPQGGEVHVEVQVLGDQVVLAVTSPGPFLGERKGGIGLELTRKRLALVYRGKARLEVKTASDGEHTLAVLAIPKGGAA
ncbi:MAG: histidine kinase [Deltaproteobacteria bacterium]|nr:histidine kinase [Deltaproteobacteria bacterium]